MRKKIKQLTSNKLIRNIAIVITGTAGAQVLTIAFSPIITRIYGPESFGILGLFMATLAVLAPIAALTYPISIVICKSDHEAKGITKLSTLLAFTISILVTVLILVAGEMIADKLNLQMISKFLLLIPLAMFFSALQQIMEQWLIRKKKFKTTARIMVSQSSILNLSKVGVGYYYPVGVTLIMLTVIGKAVYVGQLWLGLRKWNDEFDTGNALNVEIVSLKQLAYKYRDFPCFRAPQAFVSALSQSIPVLLLAGLFGPVYAGLYALSVSVLTAPASLIGNSVGNVFYQKVNEMVLGNENPIQLFLRASSGIFIVVGTPFILVLIFGPFIFEMIFGNQWKLSGEFAQWMSIWIVTSVAARPAIAIIPILNIQKFYLIYEVLFNVIKVAALVFGALFFDSALIAVAFYSIASAIFYFILFFVVLNTLRSKYN